MFCFIMSKNHKMIAIITKSAVQKNKNWGKIENPEVYDDMLYFEYARLQRLVTRYV